MTEQLNIEEPTNTTEEVKPETPTKTKAYPMDMNPIEVRINIYPNLEKAHYTVHKLRKPTFEEEEERERKMPLITTDAGKVEGSEASSMTIDDEPANTALYDKIALSVSGYALKRGEKPSGDAISLDDEVETGNGSQTVRQLIPVSHKNTAINGMFPSKFEVDVPEDEEFSFALGGGREWRVRQDIGGGEKREDGTLAPPNFQVYYTFREPSELERKKFRTRAIAALTLRNPKTGVITERRSTNLKVLRELFDALLVGVDGATVGGSAFRASDPTHIDMIPANFKKSSVIKLFGMLEADLGN